MEKNANILVTGSTGMLGSALQRHLAHAGYQHVLTPTRQTVDLLDQQQVNAYFLENKPEYVFHCAARVGGIHANNHYRAEFIYQNTQIQCNIIHAAYHAGVKKLLYPGSACAYPKNASHPIKETSLLEGALEPTNEAYAIAKLNGIKMCQAYRHQYGLNAIIAMPTNAYGIGDRFQQDNAHVIPALMQRFHQAKVADLPEVMMWGSGKPMREFIYVDDLAEAFVFLMLHYKSDDIINVGSQQEISMAELAHMIAAVVKYQGTITHDTTRPDGVMRKCLDSTRLRALGWQAKTSLREGLQRMYDYHFNQMNNF
jgi:GDP-L-fucose synthase